jgi:hypothetical protein
MLLGSVLVEPRLHQCLICSSLTLQSIRAIAAAAVLPNGADHKPEVNVESTSAFQLARELSCVSKYNVIQLTTFVMAILEKLRIEKNFWEHLSDSPISTRETTRRD